MGRGDEELRTRPFYLAIGLLPVAFLAAVFMLPIAVLGIEVASIGFDSPEQISALFEASMKISITAGFQAFVSAALSLLLGVPLAGMLAQYNFRFRGLMHALVLVPFVLPTLVTGLAFRSLFDGILQPSLLLLWLAHAYVNLAVVVRVVGGAWESLDNRYELVAATLGANRRKQFIHVILPLLKPAILRSAALVFIFTFSSLGLVLLLGGNQITLETQLLRQISLLVDFPAATFTAALQFVISISVLAAANSFRSRIPLAQDRIRRPINNCVILGLLIYALLLLAPFVALLNYSFRSVAGFTFRNWLEVLTDSMVIEAAAVSLQIASLTAITATILGTMAAVASRSQFWRKLPLLTALPLAVSSVTIGLGLLLTVRSREMLPIPEWLLPSLAHSLVALPFVSAILIPPVRAVDSKWFTLAASLGASTYEATKVVLTPIFDRLIPIALSLAIAVSLGEFGAASFLADSERPTLSVLLLRLVAKPAQEALGMAAVIAILLGLISLLLSIVVQRQEHR